MWLAEAAGFTDLSLSMSGMRKSKVLLSSLRKPDFVWNDSKLLFFGFILVSKCSRTKTDQEEGLKWPIQPRLSSFKLSHSHPELSQSPQWSPLLPPPWLKRVTPTFFSSIKLFFESFTSAAKEGRSVESALMPLRRVHRQNNLSHRRSSSRKLQLKPTATWLSDLYRGGEGMNSENSFLLCAESQIHSVAL